MNSTVNAIEANAALNWFGVQGWMPFAFQKEVWQAYLNGESGLIHSPTGTGKTYAAWLGTLMEYINESAPQMPLTESSKTKATLKRPKRNDAVPLRVLWITPLRALAGDTAAALMAPVTALNLPWTIETRTSDASSSMRSQQAKQLPTVLVTTPESLSLLLTRPNAPELFVQLRAVVVDEWHELMATKRGVQTELALARLRRWRPNLRAWGLSATMGNLDVALRTLIGASDFETGEIKPGRLIPGDLSKELVIDAVIPDEVSRFASAGHLGLALLPQVVDIVAQNRTTLIFTNTRNQTERWYQEILAARQDWAGQIALHHGSLDGKTRAWVEDALRAGKLRAVVCTSSLDLGVDFPTVDRVLQISSPKGVARLMQRAGRSGHQPGAQSRVTCVPAHALELLEISAARTGVQQGHIEARNPIEKPLDVLVQHLVTVALGGGFVAAELLREVRTTRAYQALSQDEWDWALDFVAGGGVLKSYEQYHRIVLKDGRYVVVDKHIAQTHRMSIGTIVSDSLLKVQYLRGPELGFIDEDFVSRLKPGDRFTLAGKALQFVRLREMKVWVRKATGAKGIIPRWLGGTLPLSDELTTIMRAKLQAASEGVFDDDEMRALQPLLALQAQWSAIPTGQNLLIERATTRDGHHLFFYPFEGRLVHEGLAALLAFRLSRLQKITFTLVANDYGFELLSPEPAPLEQALQNDGPNLFSTVNLLDDITVCMNATEMTKRQFRVIARVSGLVMQRFAGGRMTTKQLQVSSGLIYDVLAKYDSANLLLAQAQRDVLQRQLEYSRLFAALTRIGAEQPILKEVLHPTPFAFPLLVDRLRATVTSETLEDRVKKMQLRYEQWAK